MSFYNEEKGNKLQLVLQWIKTFCADIMGFKKKQLYCLYPFTLFVNTWICGTSLDNRVLNSTE